MLGSVPEYLKYPLQVTTTQLLGELLPEEPICDSDILTTIYIFALALINGSCLIASLPLWFVGDLLEFLTCVDFDEREVTIVDPERLSLDPHKTLYRGFPISTYQYTSNRNFCANSDWGRYSAQHFVGEKAHLAPGQGVDILTDEGLKMLCQATREANGNTIRFSIEWADILTEDGHFDDVAMEKYVQAARIMRLKGFIVMVVLHHFVSPLGREENFEGFVEFARYVHSKLKDHARHFLTFNEPKVNCVENYVLGDFPAQAVGQMWRCERVARKMLDAHRRIHRALHEADPNVTVGMTHQVIRMASTSRWNYPARIACFVMTYIFHDSFMRWAERSRNTLDLLGVQYYTRPLIGGFPPDSTCREGERMVESMHFRFDPKGILPVLREVSQRLPRVPLFVSETGTAGENSVDGPNAMDERRATYMDQSIRAVRTAQNEGIDVRGYMPWGPFRNLEWHHGYSKDHDFGLIARNERNQTRNTRGFEVLATAFRNTNLERISL